MNRRSSCALALSATIMLGASRPPVRPVPAPDAVPVAVEIIAMPIEIAKLRAEPTMRDWPLLCQGKSGEEQVMRFAVPAGTTRNALTDIFDDAQHPRVAARRYWFAGDTIPKGCNVPVLNLVLAPRHVRGGVQVSAQLLAAGPPERAATLPGIARDCGFSRAMIRPFADTDVAPRPADWRADWVTLDAGEKVAKHNAAIGCFRRLSAEQGRPAPVPAAAMSPTATSQAAWLFDQEPSMCIIQRGYGDGADRRELALREHVGLRTIDMVLSRPKLPDEPDNWRGYGKATLLPSGRVFEGETIAIGLGDGRQAIRLATDAALLDLLAASNAVVLDTGHGPATALAIDHIAVPRDTLRACHDDVMRGWGVDPARFRPLTLPGEPDPDQLARYFPSKAYPHDAISAHHDGRVVALIALAPDGHVTKCDVVESSHSPSLDRTTCDIALKRFRLSMFRDAGGKIVASWRMFAVLWVMPG